MKYRLGIDMGSTSLGWAVFALDSFGNPYDLIDMGVRIFPDGRDDKSKEPLAVARRNARGMRRNLDRRDLRQKRLMRLMIECGLMPADEEARKALETIDPYAIRAEAAQGVVPLHHLGRALFHINQRRGFKSNLKADKRENDVGNMKNAIKDLDAKLGAGTLGQYLHGQHQGRLPVRVRTTMVKNKADYNFYPGRSMYEQEVDAILKQQRQHHPQLTEAVCGEIKNIIFHQRNLLPPKIGKCRFESGQDRIRKAHPLFQKYRILQDVNHLEVVRFEAGDPSLSDDPQDRKKIIDALLHSKKKTFGQIRTLLKLPRDGRFNLESERRKELQGDDTAAIMADDKRFGVRWYDFSVDEQEEVINRLFAASDPDALVDELMEAWNLPHEQAKEVAYAPLEEGYASLSRKAIEKILPGLEEGLVYSDAVKKVYPHHSDFRTGECFESLPYYGEILPNAVMGGSMDDKDKAFPEKYFGKINNPTVHIALNQLRKLVNALIARYGHPDEIVIELARDLKEPADSITKEQTKNKKDNDRINKELEGLGQRPNYRNRMLFKLWEDLSVDPMKRCCPFSGLVIGKTDIFSGNFEEEHLLPFSRSLNDGRANKVLASRAWNRRKGNRTPYEAFSGNPEEWSAILARIQNLPTNKQWRFKEDCWDIAKGQGEDIIARQLNDTRYMSRITKQYLCAVFDNEKGKSKVWAVPGQMTALLRDKWGLNDLLGEEDGLKDRADHRHHAVDAAVIACSDRRTLKMLADAARNLEQNEGLWDKRQKLVSDLKEPFEGFRHQLARRLDTVVVSYKPDHGNAQKAIHAPRPYTVAGLHESTACGYIREGAKKDSIVVAKRVPVESLSKQDAIEKVADPVIRHAILTAVAGVKEGSAEWKQALADYSDKTGTRRVRIHFEKTRDVMIPVKQPVDKGPKDTRGKPYKLYALGGNYCAEIYCTDKGKKAGQWQCEIISNYHAHQKNYVPQWRKENPTAKLVMRLQINDMVAYEENGKSCICRVKQMDMSGRVVLRGHNIAKEDANKLSWTAYPRGLQKKSARKISVDILGRVQDPRAPVPALAAE